MLSRITRHARLSLTRARARFSVGSWMVIDGITVIAIGAVVDQSKIVRVVRFVTGKLTEKIDDTQAREVVARTVIVIRAGDRFTDEGAQLASKIVELRGPRVGIVTVAYGADGWDLRLARSLAKLWAGRL